MAEESLIRIGTLNKVIVESSHEIRLVYSCVYNTDSETKYKNALPNFVINVLLDKDKISGSDPCVDVTINTMDSMIAYENKRFKDFGFCAATLDDFANLIPAGLSAILMM